MTNVFLYELTETWNNSNISFESIRMVVSDAASQTDSKFLTFSLEANANIRFAVFKTGAWHSGNTTANIQSNSTLLRFSNATASANYGLAGLAFGQVAINTTMFLLGNSSINIAANNSTLLLSGNLFLTSSELKVGNSTVNTTVNSSLVFTTGTLRFGTRVANTTATITGTIEIIDAGGVTRQLMVCG